MSSSDLLIAVRDVEFRARCRFRAVRAALAVAAEDPATADHDARLRWAHLVLTGRLDDDALVAVVLANDTIAAAIAAAERKNGADVPDSDIDFQLASTVSAMGKARAAVIEAAAAADAALKPA